MRPGCDKGSMLGFYGERVCRRRNQTCSLFTVGSSTSATFVLPVYIIYIIYSCVYAHMVPVYVYIHPYHIYTLSLLYISVTTYLLA